MGVVVVEVEVGLKMVRSWSATTSTRRTWKRRRRRRKRKRAGRWGEEKEEEEEEEEEGRSNHQTRTVSELDHRAPPLNCTLELPHNHPPHYTMSNCISEEPQPTTISQYKMIKQKEGAGDGWSSAASLWVKRQSGPDRAMTPRGRDG